MKITGELIQISVDKISPNPWNPNKQTDYIFEKEKRSIEQHGFIDPVTVRENTKGSFQIIDGEHRWRAAKELGIKEVSANNLGKMKDAVAQQLTIILNETRGTADQDLLAALLQKIKTGVSIEDMIQNLPVPESEMHALLARQEIDWDRVKADLTPSEPPREAPAKDGEHLNFKVQESTYKAFMKQYDRAAHEIDSEEPNKVMQSIVRALRGCDFK